LSNSNSDLDRLVGQLQATAAPLRATLRDLHAKYQPVSEGTIANYIPELTKADPNWFGISIATTDGQVYEAGDSQQQFTIQSISKPFIFGLALQDNGREHVLRKVNVEPTGEAFNAIVLDEESNRPFNPMVNAGAIATTDLIRGRDFPERLARMLDMFGRYTGRQMHIDNAVFLSERVTGHRNRAIAHLMLNFGMVSQQIDQSLELYFQQCSVLVSSRDLAVMGATLANGGVNPLTGQRAIDAEYVKDVLSIMYSCGMYDYSGEWSFRVGLPAKSGVGGGIVAVVPGKFAISTYSPLLDAKGNSVRGVKVFQELSQRYGLHAFECGFTGAKIDDELRPRRGTS
jgi:glutaminase